jgi:hypothetical protein
MPNFRAGDFEAQLVPGTFKHAVSVLVLPRTTPRSFSRSSCLATAAD